MAQQVYARTILPRSIMAALVTLGLLILAGLVIACGVRAAADWLNPPPLEELAEHVLTEGVEQPLPAEIANLFSIPNDGRPLMFRKITAGSHDGRLHSIAAKSRPGSGHVDILITDVLPTGVGYHYHTATDGRLIKAVYADSKMRDIPDAADRFATEVKNWLEYLENHRDDKGQP